MTTLAEKNENGTLNGTSEVTVVAAPASAHTKVLRNVRICNEDASASITLTLQLADSANRRTMINAQVLAPLEVVIWDATENLDATTKSVIAKLAAANPSTAPSYSSNSLDIN
jgi:hypothetical protein